MGLEVKDVSGGTNKVGVMGSGVGTHTLWVVSWWKWSFCQMGLEVKDGWKWCTLSVHHCTKKWMRLSLNDPTGPPYSSWLMKTASALCPFPPFSLAAALRFKHHFCKALSSVLFVSRPAGRAQLGSPTRRELTSSSHSQITHSWVMFRDPLAPPAPRPARWH